MSFGLRQLEGGGSQHHLGTLQGPENVPLERFSLTKLLRDGRVQVRAQQLERCLERVDAIHLGAVEVLTPIAVHLPKELGVRQEA